MLGELNLGAVLGCRHFGDAVIENWAAFAGENIYRASHGADLNYDSATANTYLKHMHEDQTLQAILRFGRDQEGAVVFAHRQRSRRACRSSRTARWSRRSRRASEQ